MNRLKLLATATLMALTFTACDEGTPPPVEPPPPPAPVGTISGTVTIEGTAASGITATLSSGATTTTGSGGNFAFSGVDAGTYTVTISGFPEDATFAQVTQSATIATDGQNVQLNFAGEYIRSSAVVGNVVAADAMMSGGDGQPETLAGVTVTLGGEHAMGETMETDMSGGFAFTGLRAGTYTVTISDFPEDVSFEEVSLEISVEVGEVGQADFTGHFIRTSAVEGQVIIEGEGLAGVTVTLSGGPADDSYTMMTDADGMYRFEDLRPGDYTVSISDFDTRDYEFAATSQDVSVDLDETGTVSFTGVLLRTSGIAGRVSVEGMGLGGIEVTLSGGEEAQTAMTDDGGQYNFAGLAAGDYTVSIAVDSDAYVFESMSSDVALGDDESAIVNFEGMHARTASVSGMVFIDELMKNDMFDEGEHPLPHAGLPVALVGPGVNEQRLGATDATGAFSFDGLRSGPYQLVVLINAEVAAALSAADLAYGGPGEGYSMALGVGEAFSQSIPFDITHTTINVAVTLKGGDHRGEPVPGAAVTLYSDEDGESKVGSGMTEASEAGVYTSIKVARAGTSDNTVYMGVAADGYFVDPMAGMQAVTWDPQSFTHPAMGAEVPAVLNDADIVNLNVDVSVGGATITTDYGGGEALAGWAISVVSGDPTDPTSLMPVEGAPMMLGEKDADDEGMASLKTAVMPDALPATYVFAVAEEQDDDMTGGENFAAMPIIYTHTGLMLAGNQDAGTLEVAFTTQTLKVYAHHERDQVMGFTGNVLGGDVRDDGKISVRIRYIDEDGRSRSFTSADSVGSSSKDGVTTFTNVPAGKNVIVQAEDGQDPDDDDFMPIMLLDEGGHADELAAYTGTDTNGITGGHFGAHGGYSHTVELCPLQDSNPQDHGECSSFAYVSTYTVSGLVWKRGVVKSGDDFKENDPTFVPGQMVSLSPVDGKNLAGEDQSYTTAEKDTRKDKTKGLDATHQFEFDDIASGVYMLGIPDGWRAMMGDKGAEDKLGDALNPLGADLQIDVTPKTATVYGSVKGSDGFGADSVTVSVGGQTGMTDALGRYILDGIPADKKFVFSASKGGSSSKTDSLTFAANSVTRMDDIDLSAASQTASISGRVTASGSGDPVAGVEIRVDGKAPQNAAKSGTNKGKLVTGADGTYTAVIEAKPLGQSANVTASKKGMSFIPNEAQGHDVPAHANAEISGINFTGFLHATINGRVVAAGGGPQAGVVVTATPAGAAEGAAATDTDTTGVTGTFSLSVPFGTYTIAASLANHIFDAPSPTATNPWNANTAPGQTVNFGNIQAKTAMARGVSAMRAMQTDSTTTEGVHVVTYSGSVTLRWTSTGADVPVGYSAATYTAETNTGTDGAWEAAAGFALAGGDTTGLARFTAGADNDGEYMVRVVATAQNDSNVDPQHTDPLVLNSAPATVVAVDPSVTGVKATLDVTADTLVVDTLTVSWDATTNDRSALRIAFQLAPASLQGNTVWVIADASLTSNSRRWTLELAHRADVTTWDVAGGQENITITTAEIRAATAVRVESVQGTVSATNPWKPSAEVAVTAAGGS